MPPRQCRCGNCVPVERDGYVVCARTGLATPEDEADFVTDMTSGTIVNTRTGQVADEGLATSERTHEELGREGLKDLDFEHFAGGTAAASDKRVRFTFKAPARPAKNRRTQPVLGKQTAKRVKYDAHSDLAPRATDLVALLETAPRLPKQKALVLSALQREQLTTHVQRLLSVLDEDVLGNPEQLTVLMYQLVAQLQAPVRRGHKTNINQAYALQGAKLVPRDLLEQGFNKAVLKEGQDLLEQYSSIIFAAPAPLPPRLDSLYLDLS